ncbi:bifunctional methylenetetrahydrofolate dehydrogenase/methenyltetrahydrofolate cyclohydrolase [Clostridium baratii]|uniref:tetrahydrofolate dehydrogenase/cyclohydrolase catalytic domain-containing protein n=1 Tax=Clostridium baratii TaxID=1561 RepID=UPI0009A428E7|nr:tetrahydrofolate dehydrogenase/cyclohydrolase catalytic domain-containing protein [Clostridium baratii]OPF51596.1 bifunctional 5,10-methylene-tetrahydrofolate dehydrogenase/5,10-methylene-tetrahydrofolate cyclohydrolase [Clostridium baratii]OPF55333.1 bifunctional methylenetetrahydrofolate dehydrogenase/methenyltetrahydrofolate cyclohydrolase [Clostridium baratii]OPF57616.1 bifunctional methylenetetrahydrofolate dehydrogenase/methenyltetrahydrofolate cyclohydrolase [Clostridium baratii]OPF60
MDKIINGREVSKDIKENIKNFIEERNLKGLKLPKIASILVGNDGGSIYYLNSQEKVATSLGVLFDKIILEDSIKEEELKDLIIKLNLDDSVHGIMIQLPLPKGINEKNIINTISPKKDIDCLTYESVGKLYLGEEEFKPCTPNSILTLLKSKNIELEGKEVVVLGRSNIVGKPAVQLLLNENATVTICHSRTKNLKEVCKKADILVVAIGKPKFINSEYIKDGAVIIDVGTSSFEGKITGDVDFDDVLDKVSLITPVPGGVGALTTTLLIKNVCEAIEKDEN